jgi:hypothetical protein
LREETVTRNSQWTKAKLVHRPLRISIIPFRFDPKGVRSYHLTVTAQQTDKDLSKVSADGAEKHAMKLIVGRS